MSAAGKLVSSDGPLLLRLLKTVPQWQTAKETSVLKRKFVFKDFSQGWGFMNRVALEAEKMDHHPNWYNIYNTVQIELSTHSAGGLTEKDFKLAQLIDSIAEEIPKHK